MNTIPNHLSLVTTIEQLFASKSKTIANHQTNKDKLIYWAEKTALLQMQLNGQSVLPLLQSLLRNDFEPLQHIIAQLKTESTIDNQQLKKLEQDIAALYQQLLGNEHQIEHPPAKITKTPVVVKMPDSKIPIVHPNKEETAIIRFLDKLFDD